MSKASLLVTGVILVFMAVYSLGIYMYASREAESKYNNLKTSYESKEEDYKKQVKKLQEDILATKEKPIEPIIKEVDRIRVVYRDRPLYIVKENECRPSQDFVDRLNAIIDVGNSGGK